MHFRPDGAALSLTADERRTLTRLLAMPLMEDVRGELRAMLNAGSKGVFEQEAVSIAEVVTRIRALASAGPNSPDSEQAG
jgi:hypothetical protein